MLDVELVLLPHLGKIVGQEYVGALGEFIEHGLAFFGRQVDADAALAAIGMLEQGVAQRIELDPAHVQEPALRVTAHRMLDLDDVRAPVGQDRAGSRHIGELRHFQNAHPLHHLGHKISHPLIRRMMRPVGERVEAAPVAASPAGLLSLSRCAPAP